MAAASHRIPAEDVARPVERVERRLESGYAVLGDGLRRPALAAMDRADRPWLAHEEDLVLAYGEDLAGDIRREIAGEIDGERRDLRGRHRLHALHPRLLLGRVGGDGADEAAPSKRRDAVGAHIVARHVEGDRFREADDTHLGRRIVSLAEIAH